MAAEELDRAYAQVQIVMPHMQTECEQCLNALEAYCLADIAHKNAAFQFPAIAVHLKHCRNCSEAYAALYNVFVANGEIQDPLYQMRDPRAIPPPAKTFEISQLRGLSQPLDSTIEHIGERIWVHFAQVLVQPATTNNTSALWELHFSELSDQVEDLQIKIFPHQDALFCQIQIHVGLAGRTWPDLHGSSVKLRQGQGDLQRFTDAWGEVIFRMVEVQSLYQSELVIEPPFLVV